MTVVFLSVLVFRICCSVSCWTNNVSRLFECLSQGWEGMRSKNPIKERGRQKGNKRLGNLMACLQSPKKNKLVDMIYSSKSPAKDYSRSAHSSRSDEIEHQLDVGNIEEAESSLRESGSLNYEVLLCLNFRNTSLLWLLLNIYNLSLLCHFLFVY